MLSALKKCLALPDRAREFELINKYQDLKVVPRATNRDTYLQRWEKTYTDAATHSLPDVQDKRPLQDFLQLVKGINPEFTLT